MGQSPLECYPPATLSSESQFENKQARYTFRLLANTNKVPSEIIDPGQVHAIIVENKLTFLLACVTNPQAEW